MFEEHTRIVLTDNLVGHEGEQLHAGDVGCVVHVHPNHAAYIAEFLSLNGETVAIATVLPSQARSATRTDLLHARTMSETTEP